MSRSRTRGGGALNHDKPRFEGCIFEYTKVKSNLQSRLHHQLSVVSAIKIIGLEQRTCDSLASLVHVFIRYLSDNHLAQLDAATFAGLDTLSNL